jgi:hypothetical protein
MAALSGRPTHMSDDGVERERAVAAEDLHDDTDEEQSHKRGTKASVS